MQTDNNRVSLISVSSVASLVVQFELSLAAGRLNVNRRPRWKCISDAGRYPPAASLSSKVFSRALADATIYSKLLGCIQHLPA